MNGNRVSGITVLFTVSLLFSSPAFAQESEIEPNQPCAAAQEIQSEFAALPVEVLGTLAPPSDTAPAGDVDFYAFEAPPGMQLRAQATSEMNEMGWLFDPYLGLFDSECNLLAWNDWYISMFPVIDFVVPDSGYFTLAVTGAYDSDFEGNHWQEGPYVLTLGQPPEPIGAITGQIIDAVTGEPLSGSAWPWPEVNIYRCFGGDCWYWQNTRIPDENGVFWIDSRYDASPLDPGDYRALVSAYDYQPFDIGPFEVTSGQVADLGIIELLPPAFAFENVVPCPDFSSEGGACQFSADVRNNTAEMVHGQAWVMVSAEGLTSKLGWTRFQPEKAQNVQIKPFSSKTVRFRVDVPADATHEWFYLCAEGWFSDRSKGYFGTVLNQFLFCTSTPYGPNLQGTIGSSISGMRVGPGVAPVPLRSDPAR